MAENVKPSDIAFAFDVTCRKCGKRNRHWAGFRYCMFCGAIVGRVLVRRKKISNLASQ